MDMVETLRATLGAYSADDVRTALHEDHERILDLAQRLADAERAPRRKSLVRELRPLLMAHSRAEEAAIYTPLMNLRNSPPSRLTGNEGMVEHNLADILLQRMVDSSDAASDMWRAHAKVLHATLKHHIRGEEGGVFADLGQHFSDRDRAQMSADFCARRSALLSVKPKRNSASRTRGRPIA
jgi:hemerythrin superfamily protein